MELNVEQLEVVNNEPEFRFEAKLPNGQYAFVEYMRAKANIIYTHTEVPSEYEGMGVANRLAFVVMEYAKDNDLKVQALCPFIDSYVKRHKEYQPITWGYEE
jgi:uncharacterized protein